MLEKSGQRWKEPDIVGKNRTTFWVPTVRFFPTPLYSEFPYLTLFSKLLIPLFGVTTLPPLEPYFNISNFKY